jgi:hypothetical protein
MGSSKDVVITLFNNKMKELLVDLLSVFPQDSDFLMFQNMNNIIVRTLPDKPIMLFKKHVNGLEEMIMNKNDTMFLEDEFGKDMIEDPEQIDIIAKLKNYWKNMSRENQDVIWQYFQLLLKISQKYNTT